MMEIDEPTDLEYVEDDFEEGAHEKLDKELVVFSLVISQQFDLFAALLLAAIVNQSGDRLLAKYLNVSECETIVKSEPRLRNMLSDGSKNGYKSVRLLSKDLSVSSDFISDPPIVELLRRSKYQSKISWKLH